MVALPRFWNKLYILADVSHIPTWRCESRHNHWHAVLTILCCVCCAGGGADDDYHAKWILFVA